MKRGERSGFDYDLSKELVLTKREWTEKIMAITKAGGWVVKGEGDVMVFTRRKTAQGLMDPCLVLEVHGY